MEVNDSHSNDVESCSLDSAVEFEQFAPYKKEATKAEHLIQHLIQQCPILLVSKRTCPFCVELRQVLASYGIQYHILSLDQMPDCKISTEEIQTYLFTFTGQRTVPNLLVKGKSLGGCTDVKRLISSGEFLGKVAPYVSLHRSKEVQYPIQATTLFYFPDTVNTNAIRGTAFVTFCIVIICAVLYTNVRIKWVMLGLFVDFALRSIFGPVLSPVGLFGNLLVARLVPIWSAGPPKQFAVFNGVVLSAIGAAFFFQDVPIGGLIISAMISIAAMLECAFNICLGCNVYGKLIQYGWISPSIYRGYLNLFQFRKWTYNYQYNMQLSDQPKEIVTEHIYVPGQTKDTAVDLIRKVRPDSDFKQQDHSFIRHCRVEFFSIPASWFICTFMIKIAGDGNVNSHDNTQLVGRWHTRILFWVMFWIGVGIFAAISSLFVVRWILHPKKVWKEWFHPLMGNFFAAPVVAWILLSLCIMQTDSLASITMIWIGAVAQLLMSIARLSDMFYQRIPEEFHKPGIMMMIVSLYICSMAFAQYGLYYAHPNQWTVEINYLHIAHMYFGIASFFGMLLFSISFRFVLLETFSDDRLRYMIWIFLAATASFGQCYLIVNGNSEEVANGTLYQSMYFVSLMLLIILLMGWFRGFFVLVKDMAIWVMAFSSGIFALYAMQYYFAMSDEVSLILMYFAYVIAISLNCICMLHTIIWLVDGSLFKPRYKWAPVQFMKFQHELFYHTIPIFENMIKDLTPADIGALDLACHELKGLFYTFMQHGRYADEFMFGANRRFFPNMNPQMDEAHHYEHVLAEEMLAAMNVFVNNKCTETATECLKVLHRIFPHFGEHVIEHSKDEEATVLVSSRKYVPLETTMKLADMAYRSTSNEEHAIVLPFVVKYLPVLEWKIRYLRCYIWANPACAHELGLCIYRNCDDVLWSFLSERIPEMIPRGLPGYRRYY